MRQQLLNSSLLIKNRKLFCIVKFIDDNSMHFAIGFDQKDQQTLKIRL